MSLCILVWVLLTCNEPGHCKFGTCCVRTIEDKIATELKTNLLRMKQTKIINKSGPGASGTLRYSRCESRRMFTKFPSPLRRETACRSHDYQVTLSVPLHTLSGPGTTLHGQVLLSDRLRQTFLTTSLKAVQAIIYGRVLEARIQIHQAHTFNKSMTTIPKMIVRRRQDSREHDLQNDLTITSGQFSARYAERSEPANRNDPS